LNGQPIETSARVVAELVNEHAGASVRVAVVVNGCVVPAAAQVAAPLNEGDAVEFLIFAGGG
jgi:thiamine biosynthesis protein ThiS